MKQILRLLLLIAFLQNMMCTSANKCEFKSVKHILTIPLGYDESTSYVHYIFLEGISRKCNDSALLVQTAQKYIRSLTEGKPVSRVYILNSIEDFDKGESLSQPKSLYGSCLVSIKFDKTLIVPVNFEFFNRNGEVSYDGMLWKPQ